MSLLCDHAPYGKHISYYDPFGWVRSEGSGPPEVGHVLDHREKLLIGYGKGCEGR